MTFPVTPEYHDAPIFSLGAALSWGPWSPGVCMKRCDNHGGLFPIFARLINFCWFCFKWGLMLGLLAVVVGAVWLYHTMDDEIRRRVEKRIAQHYCGLKVTVRFAKLLEGEGIEIRGLSIVEPGAEGPHAELIYIDEILIRCRTDFEELLSGQPEVTEITIRRPTLRATRRGDGSWSAAKLLPLPRFSARPPPARIESGTIEVFDPLKNPSGTLTLRDVNLTLAAPQAPDRPAETAPVRKFQGTLAGDHLRRAEFEGWVDPQRQSWMIAGSIERLEVSPKLRDALPSPLAEKLVVLGGLRGQAELNFRVACEPSAKSPYEYDLFGRLARGRVDDARLPHPLADVRATFRINNEGFTIDNLVAQSSRATLRLSCKGAGFDQNGPLTLSAEVRRLEIDRPLIDRLPAILQDHWQKYRPRGLIDADVKLSFDGKHWRPDVSVRCLNVSFTHHKFPYRLDDGEGSVNWKDDRLQAHLTAYSRGQPVRISAEMSGVTSGCYGWFEAKGDELQLDEKLMVALGEKPRRVVRSLAPRGTVSFYVRLWRDAPKGPLHKHLLIGANGCSIRYEKFPYPLSNIRGTLEMFDGSWTFRDLVGTNDTGRVTCEGHLAPTLQGNELLLRLTGADVPLEAELRDALRPNMQEVWHSLKPRGMIDLAADVRYLCDSKQLSVGVRAEPHGERTSIEPAKFPYRMEKLRGVMVYRDGHVTLHRFRAEHGPVRLVTGGYGDFMPDGRWHLVLEGLSVDRLRLDRELIHALPGRLKKALLELNPTGPMNLSGSFQLQRGPGPGDPLRSKWDVRVGLHRGSIECGVKLKNVYGGLSLAGEFDGRRFHSRGELAIDSLTWRDLQFTRVMGPLWIDDRQVLLGSWVARRHRVQHAGDDSPGQTAPRPLTARLFGGTVCGDAWVTLGSVPRYGLRADLSRADLARCAREVIAGRQDLRGNLMATVELRGSGRSRNGMVGRGTVRLRDADIYELPLMIALLKILSIRPPDQTAFSRSDIDYRIQGEHIYLDRINFNGDAISLLGKGEMDFNSAIRLTFHAIVGRGDVEIPVLKQLLGQASQQIMLIRVDGNLHNPRTRKELFPDVNKALQQLQGELQSTPPGSFPEARQWSPEFAPEIRGRG